MKASISYYDSIKKEFVKVLGEFNFDQEVIEKFDKWLYSIKLDTNFSEKSAFVEGENTASLIRTLHDVSFGEQSSIVDLGRITSLFSSSIQEDSRIQAIMSRYLGQFQVKQIITYSREEYDGIIRASQLSCFSQPNQSKLMTAEMETLVANSRVVQGLGYRPELAQETKMESQNESEKVMVKKNSMNTNDVKAI